MFHKPDTSWARYRRTTLWIGVTLLLAVLSAPLSVLAAPTAQNTGPSPLVYVPNVGFGVTHLLDSNSYDIRGSIGNIPNIVAIDHSDDGELLFLAGRGSVSSLTVVRVATQTTLGSIELETPGLNACSVSSVVAINNGSKAYIACEGNGFVFPLFFNAETGQLTRGAGIFTSGPISLQQVGDFVFVSSNLNPRVTKINTQDDTVAGIIGTSPFIISDAAIDPIHLRLYVINFGGNRVLIYNLQTGAFIDALTFPTQPTELLVSPDSQRLYVVVDGDAHDTVAVVEGLGGGEAEVAQIPVKVNASRLASNDEGTCLYLWDIDERGHILDVIDTAGNQVSAQPFVGGGGADGDFIAPGASPQAVFLEPNTLNNNFFQVNEGAGFVDVVVRRGCSAQGTVQVQYATQEASSNTAPAIPGQDYTPVSGVLTFFPGEVRKTIRIPLIDDATFGEPDRAFALTLSGPDGAFLGVRFENTIVIRDDDAIPAGADLRILIDDAPDPVTSGAELIYAITVENLATAPNNPPSTATGVIATSVLPTGVAFAGAELFVSEGGGGGAFVNAASLQTVGTCTTPPIGQSGTVICDIGSLNPASDGAYAQITLRVHVLPEAAGSVLVNNVSVTTTSNDPFPNNNNASASTQVNATQANQPPVAVNDSTTTQQGAAVTINVLNNDSDPDGDSLTISNVGNAVHGQTSSNGATVVYTPNAGFSGNDSFAYTISDGLGGSASATVNVTVTPINNGARIIIKLDATPKAAQNVRFAGSGTIKSFTLDDAQPDDGDAFVNSRTFNVAAGSYTVRETVPSNRLLTAITCVGGNTSVNLSAAIATISVTNGEEVTCTFVNQSRVTIRGRVYDDRNRNGRRNSAEPFLADWEVVVYRIGSQEVVTRGLAAGTSPIVNFTRLPAGDYTVCETLQPGWVNRDPGVLTPPYNAPCRPVSLAPGQAVTVLFGNYQQIAAAEVDGPEEAEVGEASLVYEMASAIGDEAGNEEDATGIVMRLFLPVINKP